MSSTPSSSSRRRSSRIAHHAFKTPRTSEGSSPSHTIPVSSEEGTPSRRSVSPPSSTSAFLSGNLEPEPGTRPVVNPEVPEDSVPLYFCCDATPRKVPRLAGPYSAQIFDKKAPIRPTPPRTLMPVAKMVQVHDLKQTSLWSLFIRSEWFPLLKQGSVFYPHLVEEFYKNLNLSSSDSSLLSIVRGVQIEITPEALAKAMRIPLSDLEKFKMTSTTPLRDSNATISHIVSVLTNTPPNTHPISGFSRFQVSWLSPERRILSQILIMNLFHRTGSMTELSTFELRILYHLVQNDLSISLSHLILHIMVNKWKDQGSCSFSTAISNLLVKALPSISPNEPVSDLVFPKDYLGLKNWKKMFSISQSGNFLQFSRKSVTQTASSAPPAPLPQIPQHTSVPPRPFPPPSPMSESEPDEVPTLIRKNKGKRKMVADSPSSISPPHVFPPAGTPPASSAPPPSFIPPSSSVPPSTSSHDLESIIQLAVEKASSRFSQLLTDHLKHLQPPPQLDFTILHSQLEDLQLSFQSVSTQLPLLRRHLETILQHLESSIPRHTLPTLQQSIQAQTDLLTAIRNFQQSSDNTQRIHTQALRDINTDLQAYYQNLVDFSNRVNREINLARAVVPTRPPPPPFT